MKALAVFALLFATGCATKRKAIIVDPDCLRIVNLEGKVVNRLCYQ